MTTLKELIERLEQEGVTPEILDALNNLRLQITVTVTDGVVEVTSMTTALSIPMRQLFVDHDVKEAHLPHDSKSTVLVSQRTFDLEGEGLFNDIVDDEFFIIYIDDDEPYERTSDD